MLTVGSLFAGIGGFDLGLERAGMYVKWQVEHNAWCQRILAKHWPNVQRYSDIRDIDWTDVEPVDLICGGFPCQPFSVAGKRQGADDARNLWPEYRRCLEALKPRWVLGENVLGVKSYLESVVLPDLEALGYEVAVLGIPACSVGAPHRRERLWIVADAECHGLEESRIVGISGKGQSANTTPNGSQWTVEPAVGRVAHGVPRRVDRLRGLGNAVVPQIPELLGRLILQVTPHA